MAPIPEALPAIWAQAARQLPFLLLQAAAVGGILAMVGLRRRGVGTGLLLGTLGTLLALMVVEWMHLPQKPYLRSDLLFLAGLLGGWRSAAVCLAMACATRVMLGGHAQLAAAVLDMGVVTLAGTLMHPWLLRRARAGLAPKDVLAAWAVRTLAGMATLPLALWLQLAAPVAAAQNLALRTLGAAISLALIAAIFALLRREAREHEAHVQQLASARIDPLTGLPNRRGLTEYFDRLLSHDPQAAHTLVLIEVGNMTDMVLAHGHDWTDRFWRDLAPLMHEDRAGGLLQPYAPACFLFSDLTLAVVLHRVALADVESRNLVPRLHAELCDALRCRRPGPLPQLHYGVAEAGPGATASTAAALRNISLALRSDGQTVRYFRQSIAEKAQLDAQVRQLLAQWIVSREPPLHYQPKCDLRTGRVVGAEALLRAQDGQARPIAPGHVIDIAARHHLLAEFEWCTIDAVVRDIDRCRRTGLPISLAVNVSAASMGVPSFGRRVADLLHGAGVPGRQLALEITETSPVPDIDTVRHNMQQLHAMGVRLSLDDFGTGYSALSLLAKFPFSEVKVDHSMVARLDQPRMQAAVSLAHESARRYNATLIAEGIETRAQCERLRALGLEYGQGYLFSRAVPIERMLALGPVLPAGLALAA